MIIHERVGGRGEAEAAAGDVGCRALVYSKQAQRDAKKLARAGLKPRAQKLFDVLAKDPYQIPPPFEKLVGDLTGACSRRINIQHRLVYQVLDDLKTVKVIRMWTHYE